MFKTEDELIDQAIRDAIILSRKVLKECSLPRVMTELKADLIAYEDLLDGRTRV